ncbi:MULTISPECIES: carboxymuconolactone decarboxylase family protein [Alteribacter]|uniref:Carboxymuconolactone decarboxylase family protein n=1 Tax=Alteribacter keqinensis TaxID=2483800 RepID=A0A3M7TQA4_9BACI|nr:MULTISPECIES: carboxymuconolactone decarboxylase family protein [Alteribacter]MBM7096984.1 carboxymuconolactone decarboxylase family protein [Alteribacter salitolerans]RNA67437.1 carboxymuconolactone decarboxylase family protein [Alteribacter keqinensis]
MEQHNNQQMSSVQQALHDYKAGLGHFTEQMPDIARKYNAFTEACFEAGELTQKEKQLIALGIALYSQDEYCIIYHTKGCLDQGCSQQEILEAVAVTGAFGGGGAMSQAVTLVEQCMTELDIQPH